MKVCDNCKYQRVPRVYPPCVTCTMWSNWEGMQEETQESVEHPTHYTGTSIECIDAMTETQGEEAVKNFCICNAFKYLWRHNKKNGVEDVKRLPGIWTNLSNWRKRKTKIEKFMCDVTKALDCPHCGAKMEGVEKNESGN